VPSVILCACLPVSCRRRRRIMGLLYFFSLPVFTYIYLCHCFAIWSPAHRVSWLCNVVATHVWVRLLGLVEDINSSTVYSSLCFPPPQLFRWSAIMSLSVSTQIDCAVRCFLSVTDDHFIRPHCSSFACLPRQRLMRLRRCSERARMKDSDAMLRCSSSWLWSPRADQISYINHRNGVIAQISC